jgi:hypothetical protein
MNLQDAALVLVTESAEHPGLHRVAQSVHDDLVAGRRVPYTVLQDMIGEASGKGVLRAMHRKYSPTAFDSVLMPILSEIGRHAPIRANPGGTGRHI